MHYQLDTNIIIYHLRGKKQLQIDWVKNNPTISIITLGELLYGAKKSSHPKKSTKIVKNFIKDFDIEILPLNPSIIEIYSDQKVKLEKQGKKLDDFDLLIGATAQANNLTLVTNNKKHFKRMGGLKIYNP